MARAWGAGVVVAAMLAGCASAGGGAAPAPVAEAPDVAAMTRTVTPAELRRDLFAFADDSMRGREVGTRDATRAAEFIAKRVELLGLEPAGDSLYYQRIAMQRDEVDSTSRFSVRANGTVTALRVGPDVVPLGSLGPGALPRLDASGPVVFAGYGIDDSTLGRHDWDGLHAAGKVLVVVHGAPPHADSAARARYAGQAYLTTLITRGMMQQPAAVIVLEAPDNASLYQEATAELLHGVTIRTGLPEPGPDARQFPMVALGLARAGSPLLPPNWPADDRPRDLPVQFTGHLVMRHEPFTGYNVVAMVPGSDPSLRRTYVAYGAHLDHIGIQHGMSPDSIANGADDDGSGSMALLAIARAMRAEQPRRSVLFVWHTGEEKGLLGSGYYTEHPTVPIDSIVAQLNADMIGRNAPGELYLVGPGAAPNGQSKVLGAIVDSVNASEPSPFAINREYDRLDDPERVYYRSDHYNYARKGIPIVFFTTGLHADYHKVSDSPDKIDYAKLARVSQLMLDVGVAAANRRARPR